MKSLESRTNGRRGFTFCSRDTGVSLLARIEDWQHYCMQPCLRQKARDGDDLEDKQHELTCICTVQHGAPSTFVCLSIPGAALHRPWVRTGLRHRLSMKTLFICLCRVRPVE